MDTADSAPDLLPLPPANPSCNTGEPGNVERFTDLAEALRYLSQYCWAEAHYLTREELQARFELERARREPRRRNDWGLYPL
jgi:hypothetical protein